MGDGCGRVRESEVSYLIFADRPLLAKFEPIAVVFKEYVDRLVRGWTAQRVRHQEIGDEAACLSHWPNLC